MSTLPTHPVPSRTRKPELPTAGQDLWERWSAGALLALLALAAAIAAAPPSFLRPPQSERWALPLLLAALAGLLLIIKMHLAAQRRLLREVSAALLAAGSRVDKLEQFSFIDPQTELFNRRYLDHLFQQQAKWLNRSGKPITMLLFQLSANKKEASDHLIVEAASLLRANFRGSDYVLRYSEKQFLVLLPETSDEQAQIALHRLHDRLDCWNLENQHFEIALRQEGITCTPGVSLWESLQALEEKLLRVSAAVAPALAAAASQLDSGGLRGGSR